MDRIAMYMRKRKFQDWLWIRILINNLWLLFKLDGLIKEVNGNVAKFKNSRFRVFLQP